jgi:hypothetical protein
MGLLAVLFLLSGCGKGAPIQPYCPGPTNNTAQIHFFGDSITYGGGNSLSNGSPFGYAQMMGQDLNVTIDDVAVPGSVITSCGELPSILGSTIQPNQTYIFLQAQTMRTRIREQIYRSLRLTFRLPITI